MMTNVIAYLHTTFAYQSAVMQLMVGQANFDAQQLHLKETLPVVVPANTNAWRVAMPPDGVTGLLTTSNYIYRFNAGHLISIQKKPQARGAAPGTATNQPSVLDTNSACQLARQWLTALSVDVPALESKYPPSANQAGSRPPRVPERNRSRPGGTNNVINHAAERTTAAAPIFRVTWGGGRTVKPGSSPTPVQVSVELLGSTKECIGLRIQNTEWLKAPPLRVTNAAALLGPAPPPQHFVEEFLGGKAAYETVAKPERVFAWLLTSATDGSESKTDRTTAIAVDATTAATFARTLTDFNSYSWLDEKACAPDYEVRLRFVKGAENVDFLLCYDCDHLQVTHNSQMVEKDCDAARIALVQAIKAVFPVDEVIKNLKLLNPNQTK
jgi:hypothetical protein